MPNFNEFYYDQRKMPLYFDTINFEALKEGRIEMSIPNQLFPFLVENKLIKLKIQEKEFDQLDEAIKYYDTLNEAGGGKILNQPNVFPDIVWTDEKGTKRSFETVATNAKIGADTLILNMDTATDCMSAKLGLCSLGTKCYAFRKELRTPQALAKNVRQKEQWNCMTSEGIANAIKQISKIDTGIKYVRINEAGEFRNAPKGQSTADMATFDDIGKLKDVAKRVPNLVFYTYSHRIDLKEELTNLGNNVVINGSGFMIDNAFMPLPLEKYIEIIDQIKANRHKVVLGEPVNISKMTECVGDCSMCNKCKLKRNFNIYLPIHGPGSPKAMKLRKIRETLSNNPKFIKMLASNLSDAQKIKKVMDLLNVEDNELIKKLIVLPVGRKEMFELLIQDENSRAEFVKIISDYTNADISEPTSNSDRISASVASIEALRGKLKASIDAARSTGKKTSEEHFIKLKDNLEDILSAASKGKIVVPSKKLSTQYDISKKANKNGL
jgi:hypothetical protein